MTGIDAPILAPVVEPRRRRPLVRRRSWLVVTILLLGVLPTATWATHELWWRGYFFALTTDFDRASYARVRRVIEADPRQEGGQPFEDVVRELHLNDVPWDDASVQAEPGTYRIYHFPGFAMYATLRQLPDGVTPATPFPWSVARSDAERTWLVRASAFLRVDGLDRAERMRRYWRAVEDECDRINKAMREERSTTSPPP